jgi:undecaprenyl diphosphate synthase
MVEIDPNGMPCHVAVIMDGNGRWAERKHLPRAAGHRSGTQTARTTIETCARLNIEALTLYAFSVENWRRPKT